MLLSAGAVAASGGCCYAIFDGCFVVWALGSGLSGAEMTPEEKARRNIDRQLEQCGWLVQDYRQMNISAGPGVAVREFPLATGQADYLLYVDAKAAGAVEANPEGHTLTGVEEQSEKYVVGAARELPHYVLPLPFTYESTGKVTQFSNRLDPVPRSRELFTFHRLEELLRLVNRQEQLREKLQRMPSLETGKLWPVQINAIQNLEASLAANRLRAVVQMTMGNHSQPSAFRPSSSKHPEAGVRGQVGSARPGRRTGQRAVGADFGRYGYCLGERRVVF
jgi:hypothetical protein